MKIAVTFTCDDELRKAVYWYQNGVDGTTKASHQQMHEWFRERGYGVNEDALSEYATAMAAPKPEE